MQEMPLKHKITSYSSCCSVWSRPLLILSESNVPVTSIISTRLLVAQIKGTCTVVRLVRYSQEMVIATSHLKIVVEYKSALIAETICSDFSHLPGKHEAQLEKKFGQSLLSYKNLIYGHEVERMSTSGEIKQLTQNTVQS